MTKPKEDYYGWTLETAGKLRQNRLEEISMEDLIEELEEMSVSTRNELENRLTVLLMHLLKWGYQPTHRTKSWKRTLKGQRLKIALRLKRSPSLKPILLETLEDAYPNAVLEAAEETGLEETAFPSTFAETGWTAEQVLDLTFFPGPPEPNP